MPSGKATIDRGYDPAEASRTRAHLWSGRLAGMLAKQVFLVTLSPDGRPNAAPKAWSTPVRGAVERRPAYGQRGSYVYLPPSTAPNGA